MKAHVRLRGRRWYAVIEAPKDAGGNRKRKWRRLPAGLKGKKEAETEAAKLIVKMSSATYLEPSKNDAGGLPRPVARPHALTGFATVGRELPGSRHHQHQPVARQLPLSKLKPGEIAKAWSDAPD